MKVIKIIKNETKTDSKGVNFFSLNTKIEYKNGQEYCHINSYLPISEGAVFDDAVVKEGAWNGKVSLSAFIQKPKTANQAVTKPNQPTYQPARIGYTTKELDELMIHCINIGKNNAGDVEGCSAIIDTLFIGMTNNGSKVVSSKTEHTTPKQATEMVKDIMDGTDFVNEPVDPSQF